MHKLFSNKTDDPSYDPQALFGYEKIYQNAAKIENFYNSKKPDTKDVRKNGLEEPLFQPFTIYITLISAQNLDLLNRGKKRVFN